jgi:hypothetical protein
MKVKFNKHKIDELARKLKLYTINRFCPYCDRPDHEAMWYDGFAICDCGETYYDAIEKRELEDLTNYSWWWLLDRLTKEGIEITLRVGDNTWIIFDFEGHEGIKITPTEKDETLDDLILFAALGAMARGWFN